MSYNRIFSKVSVGSVVKDGRDIAVSIATKTSAWTRTEEQARAQGPGWVEAVKDSLDTIRPDTVEVIAREREHASPNDPRSHYTGVQVNAKNEAHSSHFVVSNMK